MKHRAASTLLNPSPDFPQAENPSANLAHAHPSGDGLLLSSPVKASALRRESNRLTSLGSVAPLSGSGSMDIPFRPQSEPHQTLDGQKAGACRDKTTARNDSPGPCGSRGDVAETPVALRTAAAKAVRNGGSTFRVSLVHNDGGTPLFDLAAADAREAARVAAQATRKLVNASAYIMPGFAVYRAGKRMNP